MPEPFVHLHLHTQYSLLDGAIKHNPLFERAKALNMPAVAMTDHGNLFGAVEFYEKALANGIKPIIGCEVYFAGGSRFDRERVNRAETGFDSINHMLLLAMNEEGYRNLMALVSKAYLEGYYYKPRIDMELLQKHQAGLIATSGCLSAVVPRDIIANQRDSAWQRAQGFADLFGDRFYLEMQRHGIPEQDIVNAELVKMSSDMRIPLLATNDAHYLAHEDHADHDALLCIGTASNLADPNRFRFDGQGFFVRSGDEMREVFHDHPSAVEASLEVAERCNVEIPMGTYHLPEFQVPAGETLEGVVAEQAQRGLRERLGMAPDEPFDGPRKNYAERLDYELGVINSMGFAGYFLVVADFIDYARRSEIPVGPGRGSSAGSLVAYGLGITGVDPIEYDIIFERFLNPERVSMPDIDVDLCMRGRDQVIRYVAEKYGGSEDYETMRVAQIVTFGTMQARGVIRDVGRVMGIDYGAVDKIAKLIPETLGISLDEAVEQTPELRARIESDSQIAQLIETARKLEGITRHVSKHAAGVVIGTKPLIEMVPLYKDPRSGDVMVQYNMSSAEKIGLIKFDFLGLKTLTLLADAQALVRAAGHPKFTVEDVPLDDERTFELLRQGDVEGVFQLESSGMRELLVKLRPTEFKDIISLNALYRPGPLGSGMVDDFVKRKNGNAPIDYMLPELEEVTRETLGVIVYQDQVLQIVQKLAGYSLGEADLLRRAMGKKKPEVMAEQRQKFLDGAAARSIDPVKAERVFDLIAEFAGYGFPKAHSTAYALITFQTAYMKANHPREYLAALLTTDSGNHDRLARYIAHAREKGFEILPPDINESERDFGVVEGGIRFGFAGVKNVGEGAIEAILEARAAAEGGAFQNIFDFAEAVVGPGVNRRVVEALVQCGAFDTLHPNRAAVWLGLDAALERGAAAQRDREIGQGSLFDGGGSGGGGNNVPALPETPAWTDRERLGFEKELLGFYVTGHPLGARGPELVRFTTVRSTEASGHDGREVRAGGLLVKFNEVRTRKGDPMARAILEDLEGTFELLVFPKKFGELAPLLREAEASTKGGGDPIPLLVQGKLEFADPPKILVEHVLKLDDAEGELVSRFQVRIQEKEITSDRMKGLRRVFERSPGECAVYLHITIAGESETVLALAAGRGVAPSEALRRDVDALFGRPVAECGV
ncbi:MAG: DNA polymerase III subunit alpha [Myxococcota bacterium]